MFFVFVFVGLGLLKEFLRVEGNNKVHVDWFVLVVLAGWLVCKEGNNICG